MTPVFLDFETYWSQTHSLTKMNPIVYVLHPDTEVQSLAYKIGDEETEVIFGEEAIDEWVKSIDWSDKMVIGHNMSGFDAMICAWRFGIQPKAWGCTMAMAKPIYAKTVGVSLRAVSSALGVGAKLSLEATNTKGKRLAEFTEEEIASMREYNAVDTDLCEAIFNKLVSKTPRKEMKLIDMTTRMLVDYQFELDTELLTQALQDERDQKHAMLLKVADSVTDVTMSGLPEDVRLKEAKAVLASAPKFSAFLKSNGLRTVPTKPSPTNPEKMIPALAKTDQAFIDLQEHENPIIAAGARARLGVKSTILETRMEKFLEVGHRIDSMMPIALNYYGAANTGRWSGAFGLNQQNLPRVNPYKPALSDALRKSLRAPEGYKVVVADLSGIELRVNHFLWQVPSSMKLFKEDPDDADLYKDFASTLYNVPVEDVTKTQRHMGKLCHLGLGFGAGPATFQAVAKAMGGVTLEEAEAMDIVRSWRGAYPEIVRGWRTCHNALGAIYDGDEESAIDPWGLCVHTPEGIKTPVGMVRYPELSQEEDKEHGRMEWRYGKGRKRTRIYAGKIDENCVQHLARGVIADMALDFQKTPLGQRYPLAHMVHDELIYVVKDEDAQDTLDTLQSIMKAGVDWWPELITSSEGDIAQTYGDAK